MKKPKKKAQKVSNDLTIQKELSKIYSNKDGSLPDISHLEVRRRGKWKLILISFLTVVIILTGIVWAGFLIFNPQYQFNDSSISLEFDGPRSIASGDEVKYRLDYKNTEKVTIDNVEIILRYPEGFEFTSATPEASNEFNSSWKIGTLQRGEKGQIEFAGKMIGEVGSLKTIDATVSYEPQNFSSTFKETAGFSSQITSSILEINLEGPEQILPEKKAEYKIKYKNSSDQELKNIKITAEYPSSFIFQESSPEPFSREDDARKFNNQWIIENLEKNQEGEIIVTGGYLADEGSDQVDFKVQIGFFDEASQDFALQQEKLVKTKVIDHGLVVDLIINGSNQSQPVSFDQQLTYSLVYKNLGQHELDDVTFSVDINSDVIDWSKIQDKHGGVIKGTKITWSKDEISELDLIRPLDEGTIDFTLPILSANEVDAQKDNLQTVSKSSATLVKIDELEVQDLMVEGTQISNTINTDVNLRVEGRYFDDDNIAVGTGPLPPVVGETTTFRVFWSIANSLNQVGDVQVKTILPDGVNWADKFLVQSGNISYSAKDNSVVWSISSIAANEGFSENSAWFDVSVTPTKQQVRKLLILTDQTTMTAVDKVNDSSITKVGKAVTSNLEDDPIGGGRGLVIDITE